MEHYVNLPLTAEKARQLRCGDTVYLTGEVYTSRDAGHKRMVELLSRGEDLPFDPTNATTITSAPARPGQARSSAPPVPQPPAAWMPMRRACSAWEPGA